MNDNKIDLSKAELEKGEIKPIIFPKKQILTFASLLVLTLILLLIYFLFPVKKSVISPLGKNQSNNSIALKEQKTEQKSSQEVIGFLPSWAVAQKANVELKSLTQLVYFGLGVNSNGELIKYDKDGVSVLEWHYFTSDYFKDIKNKAVKENVKLLVALKNFDNENIDNLISNQRSTNNLIKGLLLLLKEYKLDGVNLDFEYVTDSDFPTSKYFNSFLSKISQALKKENPKYILSIDVNGSAVIKDGAYDMVKIGEVADYVILMGYDYTTTKALNAGPVSPLSSLGAQDSIEKSIKSLAGRVPSEKIILAVPFYGYEWQTFSESFKSRTVENTGALATYKRVKELIDSRIDVKLNFDEVSKTPWLFYYQSGAIKQIYYEDEKSLALKLDYVAKNKMAGIGIWSLGYEGNYKNLWSVISDK